MNENYFNQRKIRPMPMPVDLTKNSHLNNGVPISQNISHTHQNASPNNIPQNMMPQLVNLISPQISVSQGGNQSMINMGFNATPFLHNQLYSLPNTFGALNTIASHGYGPGNVSYLNNVRMNNGQQNHQVVNYKEPKIYDSQARKPKIDVSVNNKVVNYPVRLLVNSELVGPLIGRKGEKIKEITANTGAKIDIKRESVPYSQFGLNNYMFSGCNRKASVSAMDGDHVVTANSHTNRGESQIVFIIGEPEKCTAAIQEIMQLCTQEATEQGREEPNLGLLAEDRFCARIIGKEGRYLNFVRLKSSSQVHISNVPTITTLSQQPHIISLDRIISCRGGGQPSLLDAEKLISEKIRQCVAEDSQNVIGQRPFSKLSKDDAFLPPRIADMNLVNQYYPQFDPVLKPDDIIVPRRPSLFGAAIGSGIVHKANPNWPDNLKLDENLYVRIPQICAGSIIGSEGKSVKRIMSDTGTYIQISKANLSPIESVPAVHTYRKQPIPSSDFVKDDLNQRLVTIKGSVTSQCSALAHIFNRIKICYNQTNDGIIPHDFQDVRLWVIIRIPKIMLGRLIGKDGKIIRELQLNSRTFLSFPRLRIDTNNNGETDDVENIAEIPASKNEDDTETKEKLELVDDSDQKKLSKIAHNRHDVLQNPDSAVFGDPDLHPLEIFGSYDTVECAIFMIRRLIYSCIFTQYGPALIPGPMSSMPVNQGPVPPAFLLPPPMFQWQRRNGDLHYPYFNSIPNFPRGFAPGVQLPNNVGYRNFRRPQYNHRPKAEQQQSLSESKTSAPNEFDGSLDCDVKPNENGFVSESVMSPPRAPAPKAPLLTPQPPSFPLQSPGSTYYTGYSPGNSHFAMSTIDDFSFITAQESLSDSFAVEPTSPQPQDVTPCPTNHHSDSNGSSSFSHWCSSSPQPPF